MDSDLAVVDQRISQVGGAELASTLLVPRAGGRLMLPGSPQVVQSVASTSAASPVRQAATAFVRGTTFGWGRRDLASWLVCQYSPCLVADAVASDGLHGCSATLSAASARLDDERVERLILDARCSVLRLLSDLAWPSQAATLARSAVDAGSVIELRDAQGELHWAPVGRKKMHLADRVGSLFIADSLENPRDYRSVSLCRFCGELGFTARAVHQSWCDRVRSVA